MKKAVRWLAAVAACVLTLLPTVPALAGPLEDAIYVAGNVSLYPLEYYEDGEWRGAFPELLAQISEASGLKFIYLPPLSGVSQRQSAANLQVELISCLVCDGEAADSGLRLTQPLYILRRQDGAEQTVRFALTGLISPEQAQRFLNALEQCRGETAVLTEDMLRRPTYIGLIVAAALCLCAASALLIRHSRLRRMQREERHVADEETLLDNVDNLSPLCRALWYLAFIPTGSHPAKEEQLSAFIGPESMPAVLKNGDAALFFSAVNHARAVSQAEAVMQAVGASRAVVLPLSETEMAAESQLHCARLAADIARKQNTSVLVCSAALLRQISDRELLRSQLSSAIHSGQFMLYIQPIVSAQSGRIISAEALSRWDHLTLGFVMPGRFIELVHEMELEAEFDKSQLKRVCGELRCWRRAGIRNVELHCNVSRRTLMDAGFVDWLLDLLRKEDVDRRALVVELTEEEMGDRSEIFCNLRRLRDAGILIALDDYGTMATEEDDLHQHLFDKVKIDASLLRHATSPEGELRLRTTIEQIHASGAQAICEGVETQDQVELLRTHGCEAFQGFLYHRPMPQVIVRKLILGQVKQEMDAAARNSDSPVNAHE